MSTLTLKTISIPSADFHGESSLPALSGQIALNNIETDDSLSEDDGLFLNYGGVITSFPYRARDCYDRELKETDYEAVILENNFLKAVFIPDLGGKLWSLLDKKEGKELLFTNSVVRPCNLAVRNAWLSGGVEWNCGFLGHSPQTCEKISYAVTELNDGTPVLRQYWFERIREVIVQMDIFLPEDSPFLFVRSRITNPNPTVVPMYWWSNIAAQQKDGDRVIVPAEQAYTAPGGKFKKVNVPQYHGTDISYPLNNSTSYDYFFATREGDRHYITQVDTEGYGLVQTSTARQLGRKLFVWGNSQGGRKWMNYLTRDDQTGTYNEIQCGLAHTQHECLPMPPRTTWEWCEAYGAIRLDAAKAHGTWSEAQQEAESELAKLLPQEKLEELLKATKAMALAAAKTVRAVEAWAKLKQVSGDDLMTDHLSFGEMDEEQSSWQKLLKEGTLGQADPDGVPRSYMLSEAWIKRLFDAAENKDKNNWMTYYQLGCSLLAMRALPSSQAALEKSLTITETAWAHYALSVLLDMTGRADEAKRHLVKALSLRPNDLSLAKEALGTFLSCRDHELLIDSFERAPENVRMNERCLLYYACALAKTGRVSEAKRILCGEDGKTYLVVPDIRECEETVTDLWYEIMAREGLSRQQAGQPPQDLDFRMFALREEE